MSKVISIKSNQKLFPAKMNILAGILESSDQSPLCGHFCLIICPTCKGIGKLIYNHNPADIRSCNLCGGIGHLFRMLLPSQVPQDEPQKTTT